MELPAGTHRIEFIPTNLSGMYGDGGTWQVEKYNPQIIDVTVEGGKTYLAKGVFSKSVCADARYNIPPRNGLFCTQSWGVQVEPK